MKNLPKEKRDRIILTLLGTLAALAALWYGVISAQQRSLVNIAKAVGEQKDKVGSAQRLVGSSAQIQQNFEAEAQRLKAIESTMATGDMYSWIIQTVNDFLVTHKFQTGHNKVDIPQFSREVSAEVGVLAKYPYKAVVFTVRGSAYFHDFGRFLAEFENTYPFLRVQNLELEPAGNSSATSTSDPEKLTFKMEIVALVNPSGH